MKIITNLSEFPEFKIDEGTLKSAIIKCFSSIKKPLYIHINKKLILCHGLHRRDCGVKLHNPVRDASNRRRVPAPRVTRDVLKPWLEAYFRVFSSVGRASDF